MTVKAKVQGFTVALVILALMNIYFWLVYENPSTSDAWLYMLMIVLYFVFVPVVLGSSVPFKVKRLISITLLMVIVASATADFLLGQANLISSVALLSCSGYLFSRINKFA